MHLVFIYLSVFQSHFSRFVKRRKFSYHVKYTYFGRDIMYNGLPEPFMRADLDNVKSTVIVHGDSKICHLRKKDTLSTGGNM